MTNFVRVAFGNFVRVASRKSRFQHELQSPQNRVAKNFLLQMSSAVKKIVKVNSSLVRISMVSSTVSKLLWNSMKGPPERCLNPSFPLMRPSDGHGESRFPSNTIRRFSAIACGGNAF